MHFARYVCDARRRGRVHGGQLSRADLRRVRPEQRERDRPLGARQRGLGLRLGLGPDAAAVGDGGERARAQLDGEFARQALADRLGAAARPAAARHLALPAVSAGERVRQRPPPLPTREPRALRRPPHRLPLQLRSRLQSYLIVRFSYSYSYSRFLIVRIYSRLAIIN